MNEVLFSFGVYSGPIGTRPLSEFMQGQGWKPLYGGDLRWPGDDYSAQWYRNVFVTNGKNSMPDYESVALEWHRDDEGLAGEYRDYWLAIMATHAPTEIKLPDGKIYHPKPREVVAFRNEVCYHRLNINMSRAEAEERIFYRATIEKEVENGK